MTGRTNPNRNQMKRIIFFLIFSGIILQLFGKTGSSGFYERIYVQTDKHLYLAGESVLMKLLTTGPEQIPVSFSKVAYVELVADTIAQLQIKVELTNGTGAGYMALPADLPSGYYRLIAYTQWMRNEGVDVFFEKNIAVLNTFHSGYYPEYQYENTLSYVDDSRADGLSLQLNKTTYTKRAHGELILNGLPENMHTLSVCIAGTDFIPVIETGVSLFQKNRMKKAAGNTIDIRQHGEFLPEYEGHIVTGIIVDNRTDQAVITDPLPVTGLSFPGGGIRFFTGQKTGTAAIRFFTPGISGTKEIATVVYAEGEKYRVDIQSPFITKYVPKAMPALHIDSACYDQLLARSIALQAFRYFSDDQPEKRNISEPYLKMTPTASYPLDDYTRFTTMREVFIEFIAGARFRRNGDKQELSVFVKRGDFYYYGPMPLVLLDGVPVSDHDVIYNYNPLAVEKINIYYGPYILGGQVFDGIVELTTYSRLHADLNLNRSSQILSYEGPQLPYRPVTPDYSENKNRQNRIPDGRHTLLWNPDVQTDGKTSIRLPFVTSDLAGEFQATVEGVTHDGEFIYVTSTFIIE